MTPTQIIIQEPISWWFYAFMVGFIGMVGWIGFMSVRRVRPLFALGAFRRVARKADVPTKAVSITVWFSAIKWTLMFMLSVFSIWVIIRANFCSFRQLDISDSSIRLSYEWGFLNREIPLSSVSRVDLVHIIRRKFGLEIATTDGRIYHSMDTDDEAVVSDCRELSKKVQKERSKSDSY